MKYSVLGRSNLSVSRIGLGTMMIGWRAGQKVAEELLAVALDHGVNFLDSSISYSRGRCHQLIGSAIRSLNCRSKIILATKVGGVSSDADPSSIKRYSRSNILRQCELSLRQLQTDYIDLLQLHHPDSEVAVEESLSAMHTLVTSGMVRHIGVCNYSTLQFKDASRHSEFLNSSGIVSNQIQYNLLERACGDEMQTLARNEQFGLIAWGPLASGLLTDGYLGRSDLKPGGRIASGREKSGKLLELRNSYTQRVLHVLEAVAEKQHMTVQSVAISWLMANSNVSSVLLGPSTAAQFLELTGVSGEELTDQDMINLNEVAND